MRSIKYIIVHCAATPNGQWFDAADIDRWHRERGWNGIGYHYVILPNGKVEQGREEEIVGAHVAGYNKHSIGICLIGTDEFSDAQMASLEGLLSTLSYKYHGAYIRGHNHFTDYKTCPNFNVEEWWNDGNKLID